MNELDNKSKMETTIGTQDDMMNDSTENSQNILSGAIPEVFLNPALHPVSEEAMSTFMKYRTEEYTEEDFF